MIILNMSFYIKYRLSEAHINMEQYNASQSQYIVQYWVLTSDTADGPLER